MEIIKDLIIVGTPNVGKSVIFNHLTGNYADVSNYPGTTVEHTSGIWKYNDSKINVTDTPGMYSLLPISEEERVGRSILFNNKQDCVLHVIDAKNLQRSLLFILQLIEARFPLIIDLNVMDEARQLGMQIDIKMLEAVLGIPVVATTATKGAGMDNLKTRLFEYKAGMEKSDTDKIIEYGPVIENAIEKIESLLPDDSNVSKRALALLLLLDDQEITDSVKDNARENVKKIVEETKNMFTDSLNCVISSIRQEKSLEIMKRTVKLAPRSSFRINESISRLMMNPVSGIPILFFILYLFYEAVGVLGSQILVDFFDKTVFDKYIMPISYDLITAIIPFPALQDLFVNDYGIITLALRYAIGIILPIVTIFFIAFSILEDTGYLPRLAMLIDSLFKRIGLNGRAVIPILLGFGCDTMATMATRILETKRERVIATLLLALAIPCSAQLGIILGLISGNLKALWIWIIVMAVNFIFIGWLSAKVLPGEKPLFYMEIPSLRLPNIYNVLAKSYSRIESYVKEIIPIFIMASVLIWFGNLVGILDLLLGVFHWPVKLIGLPDQTSGVFLFGFFRKDYGAAILYDLKAHGMIDGISLIVAIITLSLFVPCISQFLINIKERGLKTAAAMSVFILFYSFLIGGIVNIALRSMEVIL